MLSILVLVGTLLAHPVAPPVTPFRLTVTPIEAGYKIDCLEGCSWLNVQFECIGDCRVIVDNRGVHDIREVSTSSEITFAFELHRAAEALELTSLRGTAWLSLGISCTENACTAELDQNGVKRSAFN